MFEGICVFYGEMCGWERCCDGVGQCVSIVKDSG